MKDKNFIEIVQAVGNSKSIERLNINRVMDKNGVTALDKVEPLSSAIISMIQTNKKLTSLGLVDGYGRAIIQTLLKYLETNTTITSLDISGNALADKGKLTYFGTDTL